LYSGETAHPPASIAEISLHPQRASDRGHGVLLLAAVAPDGARLRCRRHRERLRRLHAGHDGERRGGDEFADRTLRPRAACLGAFLIDFTNAIVITIFINGWR